MSDPVDKKGIEGLLGTIKFLASYFPDMSGITAPIRDLLKSDVILIGKRSKRKLWKK